VHSLTLVSPTRLHVQQAGVEFSIVKASFSAVLVNALLTATALWLPLLPVFWLVRRIIDQRQGTG
jgi:hypothetical protein